MERVSDERDRIVLTFIQFETAQWRKLNAAFNTIQENIDDLLETIKG